MDAVTEVLLDRTGEADKLTRLVIVSLAAHAAILAALAVAPALRSAAPDNAHVMTIAIAGPEGPIQGRNAMAGREVQQAVPETAKPRAVTPPAPPKPEMVEPIKAAKPVPKAVSKPEPKKEEPLRGRTPSQGAEVKPGDARADTQGAPIKFGGLATGGGGMNSAYTDYADFCCPEYVNQMVARIRSTWDQYADSTAVVVVRFTIARDGTILDPIVEKTSANQTLDFAARRAVIIAKQLPPLPAQFPNPTLTVHLAFQYQR